MGVVHDFKIIKSAIRELKEDEDIIFLFVGNGVKRNDLELFVRENGIENIRFLPYQPRDKMKYTMNSGHLLLVTLDEKAAGLVVPSKMYAAMAAKRPILGVGSKESELWDIVSGNGCGIMVENEDSAGLVKGIRQFKENNGVYDECADKSAELFSKYFTRKIATEKFSGVLDNLTSRH
jgi:glycosyltransferase involved in cell wall biosynthesis